MKLFTNEPRNYTPIVNALRKVSPGLKFPRPHLSPLRGGAIRRIDRNGITYYVKKRYTLLNPHSSPLGYGVQFVKGSNCDPTGVFFTEWPQATESECVEAITAYLFALGAPRSDIYVMPATLWPRCYERTAANIVKLRALGAPLPHEH